MFKTLRLLRKLTMLADADTPNKIDNQIIADEEEDEMETPPDGYQGMFTIHVCPTAPHIHLPYCHLPSDEGVLASTQEPFVALNLSPLAFRCPQAPASYLNMHIFVYLSILSL